MEEIKSKISKIYNTFYYKFYNGEKLVDYPKEVLQEIFKRYIENSILKFILLEESWSSISFVLEESTTNYLSLEEVGKNYPKLLEELYDLCLFLED